MGHDDVPGSDCNAVADGLISVTPLRIDWNHPAQHAAPSFEIAGLERA